MVTINNLLQLLWHGGQTNTIFLDKYNCRQNNLSYHATGNRNQVVLYLRLLVFGYPFFFRRRRTALSPL